MNFKLIFFRSFIKKMKSGENTRLHHNCCSVSESLHNFGSCGFLDTFSFLFRQIIVLVDALGDNVCLDGTVADIWITYRTFLLSHWKRKRVSHVCGAGHLFFYFNTETKWFHKYKFSLTLFYTTILYIKY